MQTQIFQFNGQEIEFGFEKSNLMVNATEMANLYNKKIEAFMRNEDTKNFINACLKTRNSEFLGIEKEEDLVISSQKSGTYMHRVLALKFAAWLNPDFELWVYRTIDFLLFEHYQKLEESMKKTASRKDKAEKIRNKYRQFEDFKELEILEREIRLEAYYRGKEIRNQLELFRGIEI